MRTYIPIIATALTFTALIPFHGAQALPDGICTARAAMVASAAQERDKGTSKKKVLAITLRKLGPAAQGFSAYLDVIYANPKISPDDFYKLTLLSCRNE